MHTVKLNLVDADTRSDNPTGEPRSGSTAVEWRYASEVIVAGNAASERRGSWLTSLSLILSVTAPAVIAAEWVALANSWYLKPDHVTPLPLVFPGLLISIGAAVTAHAGRRHATKGGPRRRRTTVSLVAAYVPLALISALALAALVVMSSAGYGE